MPYKVIQGHRGQ